MLPNMHRPCRQLAMFCRQPLSSLSPPLFRFYPERCFVADVFIYVPDSSIDTAQLSLAVIRGIEYFESTPQKTVALRRLRNPNRQLGVCKLSRLVG